MNSNWNVCIGTQEEFFGIQRGAWKCYKYSVLTYGILKKQNKISSIAISPLIFCDAKMFLKLKCSILPTLQISICSFVSTRPAQLVSDMATSMLV